MVLKIGPISLRLHFALSLPFTGFFQNVLEDYGICDECASDFRVCIGHLPHFPENLCWSLRNGAHYAEAGSDRFFRTEEVTDYIRLADREMYISFSEAGMQSDQLDRLLLAQLRLLVSFLIIQRGGLPLHCSALRHNGAAHLFCGPSGAGKSTIASILSPRWELFNDEFNLLSFDNDLITIHATPFTRPDIYRKTVIRGSSVLGNIFFIEQGIANLATPASDKDSFIGLITSSYAFPSSESEGDSLIDNAHALSRHVRGYCLTFKNNEALCPFLEKLILEQSA